VRIFTDYHVRLSGLLSAAELLALAHSALNPLIYGLFSARTLRQSCGQRCQRRRSPVASDDRTPWRWGALPPCCCCCCCCGGQTVADMSPDAADGATPPPMMLSSNRAHLSRQQPAIELVDIAYVGSEAAHRNPSADVQPTSADASTTDTTADDVRCHKSASAEFQRGMAVSHRPPRRHAHLHLNNYGTGDRITASIAVTTNHQVPVSDPIETEVTVPPSTSVDERQLRVDDQSINPSINQSMMAENNQL